MMAMHQNELDDALARLHRAFEDLALARECLAAGLEQAMSTAHRHIEEVQHMLDSRSPARVCTSQAVPQQ